jgi:hypothetical protein
MRLHGPQQAAEYNGNTALPMATVTMLTRLATTLTAAAEQLRSVRNGAVVSRGEEPQSAAELQSYNSNTVASGEEYNGNTISKAPDSEACPPFDTARYVLGKLCPQKHEWGTTGQSLRRLPNRGCKTCENMAKKQARAAKRQATLG